MNLFGIRSKSTLVDQFDDVLGIAFRDDFGNGIVLEHRGTTKPGLYWLREKMGNHQGTFILAPGQYPRCWKIAEHKGYEALVQVGSPFRGWRDANKDGKLDPNGNIHRDVTGLNMHTTSFKSDVEVVGAYSAGCQVRQRADDHIVVMSILKRSAELYGNSFSYTLIDAS